MKAVLDRAFNVYRRPFSASGETLDNIVVPFSGSRLHILQNRTTSKSGSPLVIRFNDKDNEPFEIYNNRVFEVEFNRFTLSGADIVGSASKSDLVIVVSSNENKLIDLDAGHPSNFEAFAASTNKIIQGAVHSIYVNTFGNLQVMGTDGTSEIFSGVLPGSQLKISPSYILGAGTTCTGIIIYDR